MVRTVGTYYNVMSQLSDWKRAHMCTENYVRLRVRTMVHVYHGTNGAYSTPKTHVVLGVLFQSESYDNIIVPWYTCTMVRTRARTINGTYVRTYVHVYVPWYHWYTVYVRTYCTHGTRCTYMCALFQPESCEAEKNLQLIFKG
jgi:hypothetical protein